MTPGDSGSDEEEIGNGNKSLAACKEKMSRKAAGEKGPATCFRKSNGNTVHLRQNGSTQGKRKIQPAKPEAVKENRIATKQHHTH
jgi:hypothetical protein